MPKLNPKSAVFISAKYALEPEGGGVQRCTREYVDVAQTAGFALHHVSYEFDQRPLTRIRRRFWPTPYRNLISPTFADAAIQQIRAVGAGWVFFNQIEAAPLAKPLCDLRTAGVKFALLSHGVDSSDYLHTARTRADYEGGAPLSDRDALWLGRQIFAEMEQHQYFDSVFCLSETDRAFEQWLGGRCVTILPRIVKSKPLPWTPLPGRVGTVGTLSHAPNLEGLLLFCRSFGRASPTARLRLVGRPSEAGAKLAREFPFIDYLGALSDGELEAEAQTWCAFVNPIFCYARGCSTKLAVPLSWHLPIATTRAGARGYVWDEKLIPLCDDPIQLAALATSLSDPVVAGIQRPLVAAMADRSPTSEDLAALFSKVLH
jgi:hypothetical protein